MVFSTKFRNEASYKIKKFEDQESIIKRVIP